MIRRMLSGYEMLYCIFCGRGRVYYLLLGGFLYCFMGAAANAATTLPKPLLVTSIKPLTLIAHELAGDLVELRQLLPDEEIPHHFAMRLSQQRLIDNAEFILWVGESLETPLVKAVRHAKDVVITVEELVVVAEMTVGDPHVWLNPDRGLAIAEALAAALSNRYPALADRLADNLSAMAQRLVHFNQGTAARFAEKKVEYLAGHDAYGHFARKFPALQLQGAIYDRAGVQIGARELAQLYHRKDISCAVAETPQPPKILENLADRLGLKMVVIDPLGAAVERTKNGYLQLLQRVADGFFACGGI